MKNELVEKAVKASLNLVLRSGVLDKPLEMVSTSALSARVALEEITQGIADVWKAKGSPGDGEKFYSQYMTDLFCRAIKESDVDVARLLMNGYALLKAVETLPTTYWKTSLKDPKAFSTGKIADVLMSVAGEAWGDAKTVCLKARELYLKDVGDAARK